MKISYRTIVIKRELARRQRGEAPILRYTTQSLSRELNRRFRLSVEAMLKRVAIQASWRKGLVSVALALLLAGGAFAESLLGLAMERCDRAIDDLTELVSDRNGLGLKARLGGNLEDDEFYIKLLEEQIEVLRKAKRDVDLQAQLQAAQ